MLRSSSFSHVLASRNHPWFCRVTLTMQKPTKYNTRTFGRGVGSVASSLLGGLLFSSGFVMTLPTVATVGTVVGAAAVVGAAMYAPEAQAQAISQNSSASVSALSAPGITGAVSTSGVTATVTSVSAAGNTISASNTVTFSFGTSTADQTYQVTASLSGTETGVTGSATGTQSFTFVGSDTVTVPASAFVTVNQTLTGSASQSNTITVQSVTAINTVTSLSIFQPTISAATVTGGVSADSVSATNGTVTNLSVVNGTASNLSVSNGTATNLSVVNGTASNLSVSNGTATNLSVVNGTASNLSVSNGTATNLSVVNGTASNLSVVNGSLSNISVTSAQIRSVTATSANVASLTVANNFSAAAGATISMGGNRVQNVGNGVVATDAVNLGQLQAVEKSLHRAVAGAAAMANIAPPAGGVKPGEVVLGVGLGSSNGQTALAVGVTGSADANLSYRASVSFGTSSGGSTNKPVYGGGISYTFR
jgi:trimeric autotransporter adhesin